MAGKAVRRLQSLYPWTLAPLIVGAPMKALSGPALATQISKTGGIGFIGPGAQPKDLEGHLTETKRLLEVTGGRTSSDSGTGTNDLLPVGIGIQTWDGHLDTAVSILARHRTAAVWLFAPRRGQPELDEWSRAIRAASPGTHVWIQVASVADAVAAASSAERPDVLVVQGHDAGGHSLTKGAGLLTLLPEVADTLRKLSPAAAGIPIVGAGGIADARGAAGAMAVGAAGVALGTRFLAAAEANINPGYQRHIVDARDGGQSTVRTQLYNHLRGTMNWPAGFDARGLANQSWRDHEAGVPFEENRALYSETVGQGEQGWGVDGRMATYAGTNVGLIPNVKPAAELVKEVRSGIAGVLEETLGIVRAP